MPGAVKRSIKYFLIFIGILIMIPMILYPLLRQPEIQTLIIRRITRHFSQELKSTISVGKVEIVFFNKLNLDDILIKDRNDDTLIYAKKLSATVRKINTEKNEFTLGRVSLLNPVLSLITDSAGILNLNWYLDLLRKEEKDPDKPHAKVRINHADIRNATFFLINRGANLNSNSMDFNNLHLSDINGIIEEFSVRDDTTSFSIYNLSFSESGGFNMRKMTSDFAVAGKSILFTSAFVSCDSSILNIPLVELRPDSTGSFSNFTENVHLDINVDKSLVYTSDLQHFLAPVRGMYESVNVSGRVFGTISELRGRNINLSYMDESRLDCDFDLSGLPEPGNSFIYLGIHRLDTRADDITGINIPGKGPIRLPEYFDKLGTISFNGSFTGFTTDFVAYGKLTTQAGNLSTDISLRPEGKNRFKIKGLVTGNGIALGEITGNTELLGDLSLKADIDMYAYSFKKFSGEINGLIDSLEINRYKYRNISLNGIINDKTWDGSIKVADENIRMEMLGMLNFSRELPEFDFTLNLVNSDLFKLNLDKSDTTSSASMLLTANFRGRTVGNLEGEIKLLNSSLRRYGNTLELYDLSVRSFTEDEHPAISLRTDYADADIRGFFNPAGIGSFIGSSLSRLMPSRYSKPRNIINFTKDRLSFSVNFKNTDRLNDFFRTGLLLADKSTITGEILSDTAATIKLISKNLSVKGNSFKDLSVDVRLDQSIFTAALRSSSLGILGQSELKDFSADFDTRPDNFIFNIKWDNKDSRIANRGSFTARGTSMEGVNEKFGPVLLIDIASSDIYSHNNLWRINHSTVLLDSNNVYINHLLINSENSHYLVDGTLSENHEDTLRIEFRSIDISPLNYLITGKNEKEQLSLDLKGELNGKVLLTDIYNNPLVEGNLRINGFSILESEYGALTLNSAWNNERKVAEIRAGNNLGGKKMIDVDGYYNPELRRLYLLTTAEKLPVDALNPLLNSFASEIT
ncbi:MAG TPA: hypothetical protein DDW27_10540, partial [Bacteroidales bacterium]|nr:hypothetical protein [Bacteroidales bacterium]